MSWEYKIKKEGIWTNDDVISIQWCLAMLELLRDEGVRSASDVATHQIYTKLDSEQLRDVKGMIIELEKISAKIEKETRELAK